MNDKEKRANDAHDDLAGVIQFARMSRTLSDIAAVSEMLENIYNNMTPHFADLLRKED